MTVIGAMLRAPIPGSSSTSTRLARNRGIPLGGHDRESVRAEHRGEHVRVLVARGPGVPAVVAELERAADGVGAPGRLRRSSSRIADARSTSRPPPAATRIAGRTKSRKVTIADTGLPGRPKTSVPPGATPNQVGLPGFRATRQKTCSTPSASRAALTWSCSPTETPPEITAMSPWRAASIAVPGRGWIVADGLDGGDLGAGAERQRRDRVGVRVADAAGPERITRLQQLVAGRQDPRARTAGTADLDPADRGEHPQLGRADRRAPAQDGRSRLDVVPRATHVVARLDLDRHLDPPVARAGVLDPNHRIGAVGHHRPG